MTTTPDEPQPDPDIVPSGDPAPSQADLETTRQLIRCGTLMQIELMDHVILGRSGYYSLRERENWLWNKHDILE